MITGELVDSHCALTRGVEGIGPQHRDCAIKCIREGRAPAVRDDTGGLVFLIAAAAGQPLDERLLLASVAERVRVTGNVKERDGSRFIEVEEIQREHQHDAAPHGGVVGMIGNRHIEVVPGAGGDVRIFLLDEFMKPQSVDGVTGVAAIRNKDMSERTSLLIVQPDGQSLGVRDTTLRPGDEDITVDLSFRDEALKMTLPFPDRDPEAKAPAAATDTRPHHHPQ